MCLAFVEVQSALSEDESAEGELDRIYAERRGDQEANLSIL